MDTEVKNENIFENKGKYIHGVGRRKSASAVVKIYPEGKGLFTVNRKKVDDYFPLFQFVSLVKAPLDVLEKSKKFDLKATVMGGGIHSQAEAIRLGLSRALVTFDITLKPILRKLGYLTVNSRVKERKKPGLKRARRAPQWQKR